MLLPTQYIDMNDPSSDPFLSVQSDVHTLLTQTRTLFSSYLRIRSLSSSRPNASQSEELAQARSEITSNLSTLLADIEELQESVSAVEGDPYRFGLDTSEVGRRRQFIRDVRGEVQGMEAEVGGGSETHVAAGRLPAPMAFDDEDGEEGDDSYAAYEGQQQETMMRQQDEQLDEVGRSVGVLRGQAVDMGRELEEQGGMLEVVEGLTDTMQGKLGVGMKKMGEVIRKNEDGVSSCCIGVLVLVLIMLLILVIVL